MEPNVILSASSMSSSDVGHDIEGQQQIDCALAPHDVEQLSDFEACSGVEEQHSDNGGTSSAHSSRDQRDDAFVRVLGSEQNVGLLFMAISALCISMTGLFVKLAVKHGLPTWEIVCGRCFVAAALCCSKIASSRVKPWGSRIAQLHMRGLLGMISIVNMFFTIYYLPVADAVVFSFLAPVIITVAAPFVLGENTGNQMLTILLATIGVLLICQPPFLFGQARLRPAGVMCGLAFACTAAASQMLLRSLKHENTAVKTLYLATYGIIASGVSAALDSHLWVWPNCTQAALLLLCGLSGLGVQAFAALGFERVEAGLGVTMSYSSIIWSELIGVFIFGEIPNAWAVVGTFVVLYSTAHSAFVRGRLRKESEPVPVTPQSPCSDSDETALLLKP